ncbi:MAG: TIGR02996 domain-containing protein, partial [Gemmataceae bacterium]|nr:TIGR02996 domain-containing protein [Gemmataceae bacterium]
GRERPPPRPAPRGRHRPRQPANAMTPDNPFLQALLAQPDEDTLRLAMADWFEENDQPARAEFVRVQVELARGVPDRDRKRELELRQRDLLMAHDGAWVAPLAKVLQCKPGEWGGWVFRRGFVEYFNLPADVINEHGANLAALTPVRELLLRPCGPVGVVSLCRQPWIGSLTHLYLEDVRMTADACNAMLDCPYFGSLRVLRVGGFTANAAGTAEAEFRERFGAALDAGKG